MKDKKNTTNSNETSDSNETSENNNNFEQLIKQQDIDLANLEKIGLFFLLYGYSIFVVGANLDILEALDRNIDVSTKLGNVIVNIIQAAKV